MQHKQQNNKKRLFVGIPVSDSLKEWISDWQQAQLPPFARSIAAHNLHITLVPPWYEDSIEAIIAALQAVEFHSFHIHFDTVMPISPKRSLVWLQGSVPTELLDLRKEITNALSAPTSKRPFKMHITLARSKKKIDSSQQTVKLSMVVNQFALYESHLGAGGAEYEILQRFYSRGVAEGDEGESEVVGDGD